MLLAVADRVADIMAGKITVNEVSIECLTGQIATIEEPKQKVKTTTINCGSPVRSSNYGSSSCGSNRYSSYNSCGSLGGTSHC